MTTEPIVHSDVAFGPDNLSKLKGIEAYARFPTLERLNLPGVFIDPLILVYLFVCFRGFWDWAAVEALPKDLHLSFQIRLDI